MSASDETRVVRFPGFVRETGSPVLQHTLSLLAGTNTQAMLALEVRTALQACSVARGLAKQATAVGRALPHLTPGEIESLLGELMQAGILVSAEGVYARFANAAAACKPVDALGIPTRSRPELLRRASESFAENLARYGQRAEMVVTDDSPDEDGRHRNLAELRSVAQRWGTAVLYAGPPEKRAFAAQLARTTGVPRAVIDFALFGDDAAGCPGPGANRNALLLSNSGRSFVSVDDDNVCRLAHGPFPSSKLKLCGVMNLQARYFADHEACLRGAPFVEEDFLGIHARLLGRAVEDCLAEWGTEQLDITEVDAKFLDRLGRHGGVLRLTSMGTVGDSGYAEDQSPLLFCGDLGQGVEDPTDPARGRGRYHRRGGPPR